MTATRKVYVETYGCQMNVADSEVVLGILNGAGFGRTERLGEADVILVNTCAIRENAEARIYGRLGDFKHLKKENLPEFEELTAFQAGPNRMSVRREDSADTGEQKDRRNRELDDVGDGGETGLLFHG